jgi:hypothetical protein
MKIARVLLWGLLAGLIALAVGRGAPASNPERFGTNGRVAAVAAKTAVFSLDSLDPLKEKFRRDAGKIRLVALLSPT